MCPWNRKFAEVSDEPAYAAWALGEILTGSGIRGEGGLEAVQALRTRLGVEEDRWVREELERALRGVVDNQGARRTN